MRCRPADRTAGDRCPPVPASSRQPDAPTAVALRPLRRLGAVVLGIALVRPLLPGSLGLACPLRSLTGVPCPLCGMTTSVTEAVHLRAPEAVAANPAGVVVVLAAVVLLAVRRPVSAVVPSWAPLATVATVAGMWAYQLWRLTGS